MLFKICVLFTILNWTGAQDINPEIDIFDYEECSLIKQKMQLLQTENENLRAQLTSLNVTLNKLLRKLRIVIEVGGADKTNVCSNTSNTSNTSNANQLPNSTRNETGLNVDGTSSNINDGIPKIQNTGSSNSNASPAPNFTRIETEITNDGTSSNTNDIMPKIENTGSSSSNANQSPNSTGIETDITDDGTSFNTNDDIPKIKNAGSSTSNANQSPHSISNIAGIKNNGASFSSIDGYVPETTFYPTSSSTNGNMPQITNSSSNAVQTPNIASPTKSYIANQLPNTESSITRESSSTSKHIPGSCSEALKLSGRTYGLHKISIPNSYLKPFFVYCLEDPNKYGGAWTIIQRRIDGSINFNRLWSDYKRGFGNLEGEFFIGLERLHALTSSDMHELWIEMEDFENCTRFAKYGAFAIGDESECYALNVLGSYMGDAGDSLTPHAGEKFSTKDMDNDSHDKINCAVQFKGGWWYHKCHQSNLNGKYLRGKYPNAQYGEGIDWYHWHDHTYSLKYVHMAIRSLSSKP